MAQTSIYNRLNKLVVKYFNPESRSFLEDLISNRLRIKPEELTVSDLKKLIKWIELSASLILVNEKLTKEFINKCRELIK